MTEPDRCVMCGAIIPEGRQVCPACEADSKMEQADPIRARVTLRTGGKITLYAQGYMELGQMLAQLDWIKITTE